MSKFAVSSPLTILVALVILMHPHTGFLSKKHLQTPWALGGSANTFGGGSTNTLRGSKQGGGSANTLQTPPVANEMLLFAERSGANRRNTILLPTHLIPQRKHTNCPFICLFKSLNCFNLQGVRGGTFGFFSMIYTA